MSKVVVPSSHKLTSALNVKTSVKPGGKGPPLPIKPAQNQVSQVSKALPRKTAAPKIAAALPSKEVAKGRSPATKQEIAKKTPPVAKAMTKGPVKTAAHKKKSASPKTEKITRGFYFVPLPPKKVGSNSDAQKRTTSSTGRARVAAYFKKDRVPIQPESDGEGGQLTARLVPTSSKVGTKHSVRDE